ncbi:MAG TPA: hypothetical protein VGA63_15195 [Geopsychrobacteraceae bacterium]|jgi:hypothetical protein
MGQMLQEMVGKQLLADLIQIDANGRVIRRQQYHGTLIDDHGHPALLRPGVENPFSLPELLDQYQPVDPHQTFELETTGERLTGIDYRLTFIKSPEQF